MRTLGNYSLASFIKFIISAAWYIQLLLLVFSTGVTGLKFFRNGNTEPTFATTEVRLTQSQSVIVTPAPAIQKFNGIALQLDSGKLSFNHQSNKQIIGFDLLSIWITFAISLSITYLLRQIFRSLTQNNPFVIANARRLRLIAFLITLISVTTFAHDAIVNWFLQQNFLLNNCYGAIRAHLVVDLKTLFAGLIVLIIAEIFRIGARMKEEQDLTV